MQSNLETELRIQIRNLINQLQLKNQLMSFIIAIIEIILVPEKNVTTPFWSMMNHTDAKVKLFQVILSTQVKLVQVILSTRRLIDDEYHLDQSKVLGMCSIMWGRLGQ